MALTLGLAEMMSLARLLDQHRHARQRLDAKNVFAVEQANANNKVVVLDPVVVAQVRCVPGTSREIARLADRSWSFRGNASEIIAQRASKRKSKALMRWIAVMQH